MENLEQENENLQEETPQVESSPSKPYSLLSRLSPQNRKWAIAGISVVGALILWFGYQKLIMAPMEEEAESKVFKAEKYMEIDSFDLAEKGDGQYMGFRAIVDEYGSTKAGQRAKYQLARIVMEKGKFDEALDLLSGVSLDDKIVQAQAYGLMGDCYVMKKELETGADYYLKAANHARIFYPSARFHKKAGLVFGELKQYEKAVEQFEKIQKDYSQAEESKDVEKYVALFKTMMGDKK